MLPLRRDREARIPWGPADARGRAGGSSPAAPLPPIASDFEPPCGSDRSDASWPGRSHHDERPRLIRIRRESAVCSCSTAGARPAVVHRGRVDHDRQLDDPRTLEARERADDRGAGGCLVEPAARASGDDPRLQPAQHDRGVAVRRPDRGIDPAKVDVERALPGPRGRRDVGAEQADAHAAQPAPRREALALGLGPLDRGAPVDLDTEVDRPLAETAPAGREDDRDACDGARLCLQPRDRLAGGQTTDVDAGDPHAGGDPVGRAREGQPDEPGRDHADGRQREQPTGKQLPRSRTAAPAQPVPRSTQLPPASREV